MNPDVSSTIDSINKQIASINSASGAKLPVISIASLAKPQTPMQVTQPTPATQTAGALGGIQQQTGDYTANLQKQAEAAQTGKDSSLQSLIDAMGQKEGAAQLTNEAYAATVDPAQKELTDINNQLLQEQVSNRHQIDALKANPQGAFGTGLQQKVDEINSASLSRQADLAVVQLAKQGAYDGAKAIADRAVAAATEAQQNKIDALQLSYEANKDEFTKDEQRAFEAAQKDRQDKLDEETYQRRSKFDALIKQQDPLYQAQLAKALTDLNSGSVSITNPQAARFGTALNTILGSAKFTKDQKASLITSINSGEDPFTVIKNQAKNIMGQTEATKLTSYEAANSAMSDLQTALKDFYDAGGKTSLFSGTMEKTINSLGEVNDPALVGLATQVAVSLQSYRNAISGTAYSDQEGKDIASIFPGINNSKGLNDAIVNARIKANDSIIDGIYKTALGDNTYSELKSAEDSGAKADQSDKDFVESTLNGLGVTYDSVVSKVPPGKKAVIVNKDGSVGYIDAKDFDPSIYTSI